MFRFQIPLLARNQTKRARTDRFPVGPGSLGLGRPGRVADRRRRAGPLGPVGRYQPVGPLMFSFVSTSLRAMGKHRSCRSK